MKTIVREFDFRPIIKKLSYVVELKGGDLDKLVMETTAKVVSSPDQFPGLVQILPPAHKGVTGEVAGQHGAAVVRSDILKVYATPDSLYSEIEAKNHGAAKAFIGAIRNKPHHGKPTGLPEARRILQSTLGYGNIMVDAFDGGKLHQQLRNRTTGRVVNKRPLQLVSNPEALQTYIEHKQGNVGIMGSAATRAGMAFGSTGIPEFILRHGVKYSGLQILRTPTAFWIIVDPLVPFGQSEIARRVPYVLRYRKNALGVSIGLLIRHRLQQKMAA